MPICNFCGKEVRKYKNKGLKKCSNCYEKQRPKEICISCGKNKKPHKRNENGEAICGNCVRISNKDICLNCNKLADIRIRIDEKAVCGGCYNHYKKKEICYNCKNLCAVQFRQGNKGYCHKCYRNLFQPKEICLRCGENKPVECRKEEKSICKSCYRKYFQPKKKCIDCGKSKVMKAKGRCQICDEKYKKKTDENYRIKKLVRNRINVALKRNKIPKKPCKVDYEGIIKHLGPCPGSRKDYHIDHVIPLAFFDLRDPEQFRIAFAPENHQWLTAEENLRKGAKLNADM